MVSQIKSFSQKRAWGILVLTLCFGVMSGFAPFLHSHDFDLAEVHKDCSPCHWSHSHNSIAPILAPLDFDLSVLFDLAQDAEKGFGQTHRIRSGRSPPLFS